MRPTAESSAIRVRVDNRQADHVVDADHLAALMSASLEAHAVVAPAEAGLAFISADEMAELNIEHMHGSGPTDVLAFPIDGARQPPAGQPALVGDVVVCPAVAAQAQQSLADELALLVVHGSLHLVGHDHAEPDEKAVMQGHERDLLLRFHKAR